MGLSESSGLIGWALDGFPIMTGWEDGAFVDPTDLDERGAAFFSLWRASRGDFDD